MAGASATALAPSPAALGAAAATGHSATRPAWRAASRTKRAVPRSGLDGACTTSSSDSGRVAASWASACCRSPALPDTRRRAADPVGVGGRPGAGQACSGGSSNPITASEPGAPGGPSAGAGAAAAVARCSGSITWGGGSSASRRCTMRRTYGSAMSTPAKRRAPARQRAMLKAASSARGSRP